MCNPAQYDARQVRENFTLHGVRKHYRFLIIPVPLPIIPFLAPLPDGREFTQSTTRPPPRKLCADHKSPIVMIGANAMIRRRCGHLLAICAVSIFVAVVIVSALLSAPDFPAGGR
jgi:hypothetical protein